MKREIQEVLDAAILILERMKNDYSLLIEEPLNIEYEQNQYKPYFFMTAVLNSLNSQTRK